MAAAAAVWRQHGIGSGSTIYNQLKALAAMASKTVMMTATTRMIKMKATATGVAAWRQCGGGGGGSAATAAVVVAAQLQRRGRGRPGRQCGGIGGSMAAA